MNYSVANKHVVVTGASSGIGLNIAQAFVSEGSKVCITGRQPGKLAQAYAALPDALAFQAELSDVRQVQAFAAHLQSQWPRVDILVVNAGNSDPKAFSETDEASFDLQVNNNFKSAFFTVQALLPLMHAGSAVVLVSSASNVRAAPRFAVYAACKAALRSLTQTLAIELAPLGIRVNAVAPGPVATETLGARWNLTPAAREHALATLASTMPSGRLVAMAEVAQAVMFLASPGAQGVNGTELFVDGAWTQR